MANFVCKCVRLLTEAAFGQRSRITDLALRQLRDGGSGEARTGICGTDNVLVEEGLYLFLVSFFPQLVSGTIVRAKDFLPQILV